MLDQIGQPGRVVTWKSHLLQDMDSMCNRFNNLEHLLSYHVMEMDLKSLYWMNGIHLDINVLHCPIWKQKFVQENGNDLQINTFEQHH